MKFKTLFYLAILILLSCFVFFSYYHIETKENIVSGKEGFSNIAMMDIINDNSTTDDKKIAAIHVLIDQTHPQWKFLTNNSISDADKIRFFKNSSLADLANAPLTNINTPSVMITQHNNSSIFPTVNTLPPSMQTSAPTNSQQPSTPPSVSQQTSQAPAMQTTGQPTTYKTSMPSLPQQTSQAPAMQTTGQPTAYKTSMPSLPQFTSQSPAVKTTGQPTTYKTNIPSLPQFTSQSPAVKTTGQPTAYKTSMPSLPQFTSQSPASQTTTKMNASNFTSVPFSTTNNNNSVGLTTAKQTSFSSPNSIATSGFTTYSTPSPKQTPKKT